jgi:hypothetical protein
MDGWVHGWDGIQAWNLEIPMHKHATVLVDCGVTLVATI